MNKKEQISYVTPELMVYEVKIQRCIAASTESLTEESGSWGSMTLYGDTESTDE